MELKLVLIILSCVTGISFLLWVLHKNSIKEAIKRREYQQQVDDLVKNQKASIRKAKRDKERKSKVGTSINPNDPWSGMRR